MSDNWIVQNLENALDFWNGKLREVFRLLTTSPDAFKDGKIWTVMTGIYGTLQAVGYALLVVFFVIGVVKVCGSFAEIKRPEAAGRLFIRFILAKAAISYGMEVILMIVRVTQGIAGSILDTAGISRFRSTLIPDEIIEAIENVDGIFSNVGLWAVTLIGSLVVWVLAFVMILSVYGRFFRIYLYTAIAPVPLATMAGEPTQHIARSFVKSFAGVCLEGAVIVLACTFYQIFVGTAPEVDLDASASTMVWTYLGEVIFNMLILVGTIKGSDRVVREMMGL